MAQGKVLEKIQMLVLDDDPLILRTIQGLLYELPLAITTAENIAQARNLILENPEFGIILCDHLLPDGAGVDFLRELRTRYPSAIRILMTGAYDREVTTKAINSGEIYRFLVKPFTNEDLLAIAHQSLDRYQLQQENARLQQQLAIQNEELRLANQKLESRVEMEQEKSKTLVIESGNWRRACQNMVDLCLEIMQRLDTPLFKHSQRVSQLAVALARDMGYEQEFLDWIELAASLHDIGLLGASPALQASQRELNTIKSQLERDYMVGHPELSATLVKFLPVPEVMELISEHHEYYDGSGYPNGMAGEQIPMLAHILIVADAYDEQKKRDFALQNIEMNAGKLYHPDVVRGLVRLLGNKDFKLQLDRPVLISELKSGMKLATSIYTASGMLLVKQGQVLSDSIISKLVLHDSGNMISQAIYVQSDA
jgi:response regulator RpfG family c-di-GMP phosphodiesterase